MRDSHSYIPHVPSCHSVAHDKLQPSELSHMHDAIMPRVKKLYTRLQSNLTEPHKRAHGFTIICLPRSVKVLGIPVAMQTLDHTDGTPFCDQGPNKHVAELLASLVHSARASHAQQPPVQNGNRIAWRRCGLQSLGWLQSWSQPLTCTHPKEGLVTQGSRRVNIWGSVPSYISPRLIQTPSFMSIGTLVIELRFSRKEEHGKCTFG